MPPRTTRLLIGAILGLLLGMLYGWLIRPVEYINTTPDSLRIDFRTDVVLMTAEAFSADGDVDLAQFRLAALGPHPPADYATEAIDYALENSFSQRDVETLNQLAIALRTLPGSGEISVP